MNSRLALDPCGVIAENQLVANSSCSGALIQTTGRSALIVTASVVERVGGFGFGGGFGIERDEAEESRGGGGGGGGGGSAIGRPVAVIDIGPEGVTVRPVVDATRIGITVATSLVAAIGVARGVRRLVSGRS